jgi:hypothetical protein
MALPSWIPLAFMLLAAVRAEVVKLGAACRMACHKLKLGMFDPKTAAIFFSKIRRVEHIFAFHSLYNESAPRFLLQSRSGTGDFR